jgi:protein-S-isoprenylcysteine O-methyltransferase Ste14
VSDRANTIVFPPFLLLGALASGVFLKFLFPTPLFPSLWSKVVGALVVALSVVVLALAARALRQSKTAFDVRRPTTHIVSSGIFGMSRNPVYFSMLLLHLGLGLLLNSLWMTLLVVPFGSALCLAVIKPEERYLEDKFGDTYRSYKASARRWI